MTKFTPLGTGALLAALLGSTAAFADVTPKDVWQAWQAGAAKSGANYTADSEEQTGDTLVVSGVTLGSSSPHMQITGKIDTIAFRDQGDGTVAITLSPDVTFDVMINGESGKTVTMTLNVRDPDSKLVASGQPDAVAYTYDLPELTVSSDSIAIDGKDQGATFTVSAKGIAGTQTPGEGMTRSSDVKVASVDVAVDGAKPDGTAGFSVKGSMQDVTESDTYTPPADTDMSDLSKALQAGLAIDATVGFGATDFRIESASAADKTTSAVTVTAGTVSVKMDKESVSYGTTSKGLSVDVQGGGLPIPQLTAKIASQVQNIVVPLAKSDEPQDFSYVTRLENLELGEEVWSLFDPQKALPRDPATLIVDIAGKGNVLMDMFSMSQQPTDQSPVEMRSVSINALDLKAVGAELSGTGAFTFDNANAGANGMPAPTGSVDLTLVGGNALLDKLVEVGLLPQDQATGARMMLGLLARPGEGEDTLVSKIEVKDGTKIVANGQPLN